MGDVVYAVEDSTAVLLWYHRPDETPVDITEDMTLRPRESM
jgi:hypothetical protein